MLDYQGDVFLAFAKWRNLDRKNVEAVEEIFAEAALADLFSEVLVGGRNQADVDLDRATGTDRVYLTFLNRAQQLDLNAGGQIPDLVQEQRAGIGFHEFADVAFGCARECTLLVSEKDAFHQIVGNRTTIDGDEGLAAAPALTPNGARDQFLADARFAFDDDGDIGGSSLACEAQRLFHGRTSRDALADRDVLARLRCALLLQGLNLARSVERFGKAVWRDGLDDKVEGARAHGCNCRLDAAAGRLDNDRHAQAPTVQAAHDLHAIHAGHHQVEDDGPQFGDNSLDELQSALTTISYDGGKTEFGHRGLEKPALGGVIVNNKNLVG